MSFLKKFSWQLFLVVLFSAIIRFPFLVDFPPALLQDEAALGFNAISLAQTGKDEWGTSWPVIFKSFGDDKPPVYFYATAGLYKLIGYSPALPRITSALAGIGLVIFMALWLKKALKSEKMAIIGALIVAINPWTWQLSRTALEANLGLLLFVVGLFGWQNIDQEKSARTKLLLCCASILGFTLSAYTFHSYRFMVGSFLFATFFITTLLEWFKTKKFRVQSSTFITLVTILLVLPGVLGGGSLTRFNQTSLVNTETINNLQEYYRGSCHLLSAQFAWPLVNYTCKAIWNAKTWPVLILGESLTKYLSPNFLFFTGDAIFNHNPAKFGAFFVVLFPAYVVGLVLAFKKLNQNWVYLLGYLLAIIPSLLTGEPHAFRLTPLVPFVVLIMCIGVQELNKIHRAASSLMVVLMFGFLPYFLITFATTSYSQSQEYLSHTQQISKLTFEYYQQGYSVYLDHNVMPEGHIFFLFWNNFDPKTYQELPKETNTDPKGFIRPTKIGDRLFIGETKFTENTCLSQPDDKIVIVTNEVLPFAADHDIYNATKALRLAGVYTSQGMRAQTKIWQGFCQPN